MAERLTVTPFPKDMKAVLEHLVEYSEHKSTAIAIRKCGILYAINISQRSGSYPMGFDRVSKMTMNSIAMVVENQYSAFVLLKYEGDDHNDTEEDGEVSEPCVY